MRTVYFFFLFIMILFTSLFLGACLPDDDDVTETDCNDECPAWATRISIQEANGSCEADGSFNPTTLETNIAGTCAGSGSCQVVCLVECQEGFNAIITEDSYECTESPCAGIECEGLLDGIKHGECTVVSDNPKCVCYDGYVEDGRYCNPIGKCLIDGEEYSDGDGNQNNACLVCDVDRSTTSWSDNNGVSCNDGKYCNGTDACLNGACQEHVASPCDEQCQKCNEESDQCENQDGACDDKLFCNGVDTCSGGACTQHAGIPCDTQCQNCVEETDQCTNHDGACDDKLFCNGADTCSAGSCSQHDNLACDAQCQNCDETTDQCENHDGACDDELFCNGADTCSEGACMQHAGIPCDAQCQNCVEETDQCENHDGACNDELFCNGGDTCSAGSCSQHDNLACDTQCQNCIEATDQCENHDGACDDELFCNGADTCSAGSCSQHVGNPCDAQCQNCIETTDECENHTGPCNDESWCTENDACDEGVCAGTDRDCSDGEFCNGIEVCNYSTETCDSPGDPCSVSEQCDEDLDICDSLVVLYETYELIWQRYVPTGMIECGGDDLCTQQEAADYCQALADQVFAGISDWRLPNVRELYTLTDKDAADPAIDLLLFPDTPEDIHFWTSTNDAPSVTTYWYERFDEGAVQTSDSSSEKSAKCVSGESPILPLISPPNSEFIVSNPDVVFHSVTSLYWQRYLPEEYQGCDAAGCTWENAENYCFWLSTQNYGGYNDWRLPTTFELQGIVDYGLTSIPSIDLDAFPDTPGEAFWCVEPLYDFTGVFSWTITFNGGNITGRDNSNFYSVRCVRP